MAFRHHFFPLFAYIAFSIIVYGLYPQVIMKRKFASFLLLVFLVPLFFSCSGEKGEYLSLPVKEVDYLGKCSTTLNAKPVDWGVLGCHEFVIKDSLCLVLTEDAAGMLAVVSLNSNSVIGKFCTRGRAGNEFNHVTDILNQPYVRNGDIFYPLEDYWDGLLKTVNVSESLRKHATVIDNSCEFNVESGSLLDNDVNRIFQQRRIEPYEYENLGDKAPVSYWLYEGDNETELEVFPRRVKYDCEEEPYLFCPYGGSMFKNPGKNIVVDLSSGLDYIFYFNFENNKHFAIHQKGSVSYDDAYPGLIGNEMFFTDAAVADDFFFVLYWHEGNDWNGKSADFRPELLAFDWKGNFLGGYKLKERISRIEYDAIHDVIYGMTTNEDIYLYENPLK